VGFFVGNGVLFFRGKGKGFFFFFFVADRRWCLKVNRVVVA